jgi:DNA-binding Xre family transcriptional regulator
MSTTVDLVQALKNELKTARMTYADLARALGMAESSVKRMLAKSDMPLSRVDAICRALKMDFAELARRVADAQPLLRELTHDQEKAVVKDKKLILVAISVLSQWTLEQIVAAYRISEAECIGCFAQLDRIGIIELRPLNRYRLKLAKTFRWRPHGPVMDFFARIDQPRTGPVLSRATAARGPGFRATAPDRSETLARRPRGLHAAAGHAQLGIRSLHTAATCLTAQRRMPTVSTRLTLISEYLSTRVNSRSAEERVFLTPPYAQSPMNAEVNRSPVR